MPCPTFPKSCAGIPECGGPPPPLATVAVRSRFMCLFWLEKLYKKAYAIVEDAPEQGKSRSLGAILLPTRTFSLLPLVPANRTGPCSYSRFFTARFNRGALCGRASRSCGWVALCCYGSLFFARGLAVGPAVVLYARSEHEIRHSPWVAWIMLLMGCRNIHRRCWNFGFLENATITSGAKCPTASHSV